MNGGEFQAEKNSRRLPRRRNARRLRSRRFQRNPPSLQEEKTRPRGLERNIRRRSVRVDGLVRTCSEEKCRLLAGWRDRRRNREAQPVLGGLRRLHRRREFAELIYIRCIQGGRT